MGSSDPYASLDELPTPSHPEVAFAGRSNVGKSSLINAIIGTHLAPVSRTPGKTRTIRLYLWQPPKGSPIGLVDLPGYGWAALPRGVRERWHPLLEGYLSTRTTLRGVVLVADIRRGGTELDRDMASWLRYRALPYLVVATKVDKVAYARRPSLLAELADATGVPAASIVTFSALGEGRREVRRAVQTLAAR